jgi:hypothetical protein
MYRSSKTLSYIAAGLLGGLILCAILFILSSFGMLLFSDSVIDLEDGEPMPVAFVVIGILALLRLPLFLATVVFFLIWEHRAFSNLSALKAENLQFSPGWAVGWWFIPFANLIKPFQAMRELWNESDPEYDAESFLSVSAGAPLMMGFWWAFWLLSNFAHQIANKIDDLQFFPVALITASILEIIAAGLLIKIIFGIVERQELRHKNIGEQPQFAPPQPPVFNQAAQN